MWVSGLGHLISKPESLAIKPSGLQPQDFVSSIMNPVSRTSKPVSKLKFALAIGSSSLPLAIHSVWWKGVVSPVSNSAISWLMYASALEEGFPVAVIILEKLEAETNNTKNLKNALMKLDMRSREIVEARWLNENKPNTLHDLAKRYKVSAERIRQIEKNAMKKIKTLIKLETV